jgi:hypothetical protein
VQDAVANAVDAVVDIPGGYAADHGTPGNPNAAENKAEADAFTTAKKAWLECMKASPAPTDAEPTASPCGEKPNPHDFRADKTPKPDRTPKGAPERSEKPERTTNPNAFVGNENSGDKGGELRPERTPKPSRPPVPTPPSNPGEQGGGPPSPIG